MTSKKFLIMGLFVAGLAATSFAAYQQFSTECCAPSGCASGQTSACCADGQLPDCCKAE